MIPRIAADELMPEQPQRPARTLRVTDENAIPTVGTQKTLHQRNKSSPALSSMLHAGGLRPSTKRTAFGDVSNIANVLRPSKDDSAIGGKGDYPIQEKPQAQYDRKTASFLRPAQRPLSVSGLKGLLNVATTNQQPVKQPLSEIQQPAQPTVSAVNTHNVLAKGSTAVFKDSASTQPQQPSVDLQKPLPPAAPIPPVHRELQARPPLAQPEHAQQPLPELRRKRSEHIATREAQEITAAPSVDQASSDEPAVLRSDGIYIDNQGQVRLYEYTDTIEHVDIVQPVDAASLVTAAAQKQSILTNLDNLLDAQLARSQPDPLAKSTVATVTEPEEYWDEEGEENYDEEGYVTARSFRSRGENTTGGATTVLFPKVNQKAKKEIAAARELIEGSKTAQELEDEAWDTTMVAEYGEEIFQYMKDLEVIIIYLLGMGHANLYDQIKMLPNAHYMDNQAEIQWSMRAVLMDWIVQVHHRFNLLPETLFLCVNYIDRFLSCKVVSLGKLQLVGATAIFIAAKYEEIDCPSVQEIVYMVDGGYTVDEILKAERFMLSMLQFELGWPGPMSFLRRISKADDYDLETRTLAKYFLEITIMDERFVGSPPSFVAAAAHCLARMMLKKGTWVSSRPPGCRDLLSNIVTDACTRVLLQLYLLPTLQHRTAYG